jgi:hypothetical protein
VDGDPHVTRRNTSNRPGRYPDSQIGYMPISRLPMDQPQWLVMTSHLLTVAGAVQASHLLPVYPGLRQAPETVGKNYSEYGKGSRDSELGVVILFGFLYVFTWDSLHKPSFRRRPESIS